jgi:hypothetical protein
VKKLKCDLFKFTTNYHWEYNTKDTSKIINNEKKIKQELKDKEKY